MVSGTGVLMGIRSCNGMATHGIKGKRLFFGLCLGEGESAIAFLPLTAFLEEVNALVTLEDIATNSNLAGALERCMEAHVNRPFF